MKIPTIAAEHLRTGNLERMKSPSYGTRGKEMFKESEIQIYFNVERITTENAIFS